MAYDRGPFFKKYVPGQFQVISEGKTQPECESYWCKDNGEVEINICDNVPVFQMK